MSTLKYDYEFDPEAVNNTAAAIFRAAVEGGPRVLDLGSGPAIVSKYLHEKHGREVTCVDSDAEALESLSHSGLRTVLADLEGPVWLSALKAEGFDVVILADVLEHLREPGALLARIAHSDLLTDDGMLVISVPNAAHESVVAELLLGDFKYSRTGILDSTHLRWFTLESLRRLLEQHGFVVCSVQRTTRTLEQTPSSDRAAQVPVELRRRARELNPDSDTYQFIVRARRSDAAGQLLEAREALERNRAETFRSLEIARATEADLRSKLLQVETDLDEQTRSHADGLMSLAREHAEAMSELHQSHNAEVASLHAELGRARSLLAEERENVAHEMELGAAELAELATTVQQLKTDLEACRKRNRELRTQRAALRETRAAHQRQLARYENSRAVRLTSRSVWAVRRVVGNLRRGR